jgi:hypothetical protein
MWDTCSAPTGARRIGPCHSRSTSVSAIRSMVEDGVRPTRRALGGMCGARGRVPAVSRDESSLDRAGPSTGTARAVVFETMSGLRHHGVIDQWSPWSTVGAAHQTSHEQAGEPRSRRPGRGCRGGGGRAWSAPSWCCCRFGEHLREGAVTGSGPGERYALAAPPNGSEVMAPRDLGPPADRWCVCRRTRHRAALGGAAGSSGPPLWSSVGWVDEVRPGRLVSSPSGEHAPGFSAPGARRGRRAGWSRPGCGIPRRAAGSPRSPWGTPSRPARA